MVKSKSNITNNIVSEADGRLRCVTADGKPCSAAQVQEMAELLMAQGGLKALALASPDGTLRCQTADGKACTAGQVSERVSSTCALPAVGALAATATPARCHTNCAS